MDPISQQGKAHLPTLNMPFFCKVHHVESQMHVKCMVLDPWQCFVQQQGKAPSPTVSMPPKSPPCTVGLRFKIRGNLLKIGRFGPAWVPRMSMEASNCITTNMDEEETLLSAA